MVKVPDGGSGEFDHAMAQRVQYQAPPLLEEELASTPLGQFRKWFADAVAAGLPEPNAVSLATCGLDGPSVRMVLAKEVRPEGVRFFTNRMSRKARQIEDDPRVAMGFAWIPLHRQVLIRGRAEPLPRAVAESYFSGRPRDDRLGAWVSMQSAPIESRASLYKRVVQVAEEFPEGMEVPMPDYWGGYLVRASSVEFWQGQPSRLHDRLRFKATTDYPWLDEAAAWTVERLQP